MMKMRLSMAGIFLVCSLVLALGGIGHAQTGQTGEQQTAPQSPPGVEYSDADLKKVASAYAEIHEIRMDLQQSLASVTDPSDAQQIQEQAGAAMIQAVQDNGLNVDTYNQIMQEVQTNTNLREKLESELENRQ